jgi:hypothetical protein
MLIAHNPNSVVDNLRILNAALSPNLYGFLLFDERPSHAPIERFVANDFDWLDDLARSAQIILFVYVAKPKGRIAKRVRKIEVKSGDQIKSERVILIQSRGEVKNPSLVVARMLGIEPKQLPGIAFFQRLGDDKGEKGIDFPLKAEPPKPLLYRRREDSEKGIYFPLKAELFEKNVVELERVFNELFGIIQRCQSASSSSEELYENVRQELRQMEREERLRPVLAYLKTSFVAIIALPTGIMEAASKTFVETFAEAMARHLTGP